MLLFGDVRAYPALEGPPWRTFASPNDRFMARLTHLESTLIEMRASVDSKPLTLTLSPLDATLMKNIGVVVLLWLTRNPFGVRRLAAAFPPAVPSNSQLPA